MATNADNPSRARRVFFFAGEASGDTYAEQLARRLPADIQIEGVGSNKLASVAKNLVADSSDWGAVSITESLKVVPRVYKGYRAAKNALASGSPGVFVPIDFGAANIGLSRWAKARGWHVVYFIPPGSWRRDRQGSDLPAVTHQIITPFEWSAELLNQAGAMAHWFGHPLVQMIGDVPSPDDREGIAVLPGSREHEIDNHLPLLAQSLSDYTGPIRMGVAPNLDVQDLSARWYRAGGKTAEFLPSAREALKHSQAAIVCSGTATLEAALCQCPSVVVYRGTKLMEFEAKLRGVKIEHISLPNILLQRPAVPELIQHEATVENIRECLLPLLETSPARRDQLLAFEEIRTLCGSADALDQAATVIADALSN